MARRGGPVTFADRRRVAVLVACAVLGAGGSGAGAQTGAPAASTFTDVTAQAGIEFTHDNGATGDHWYPELFGGGVAVLDLDNDGWPDLLFVNGRRWGAAGETRHGLFRNNRDGTFADVFAGSGLDGAEVYGLGAAVADYDNDGRDDVFLTTVDGGRLYRNAGDGTFRDATAGAGIGDGRFAVSAAWLDHDRDGLVDLFVGNYVDWVARDRHGLAASPPGVLRSRRVPSRRTDPVPQRRAGSLRGRHRAQAGLDDRPTDKAMGGRGARLRRRRLARRCSSAATACPRSCTATPATGASRTWGCRPAWP